MVSLVNFHKNATSKRWHLWEIELRFASGLPPGRIRGGRFLGDEDPATYGRLSAPRHVVEDLKPAHPFDRDVVDDTHQLPPLDGTIRVQVCAPSFEALRKILYVDAAQWRRRRAACHDVVVAGGRSMPRLGRHGHGGHGGREVLGCGPVGRGDDRLVGPRCEKNEELGRRGMLQGGGLGRGVEPLGACPDRAGGRAGHSCG